MTSSLNTYLLGLASSFFISHGSTERNQIINSIVTLQSRLNSFFGTDVKAIKIFGSWDRDTTLPRKYDFYSDVDIMIIFDHENLNKTAETYRTWLKTFAEQKYSSSIVQKDFPTVRLDMNHITFDLIPTRVTNILNIIEIHYIPDSGNNWMTTEPFKFTQKVKDKHSEKNYIVKPVLRLIKAWNIQAGYPFDSYLLEKEILEKTPWFWNNSVEHAFYAACNSLCAYSGNNTQNTKVQTLQNAIGKVMLYLDIGDVSTAKYWLHKVLPR